MRGVFFITLVTATGLIFATAATAQTDETKRSAPARAEAPADKVKAPETPQENAAIYVKIDGVDGESKSNVPKENGTAKNVTAPEAPQENAAGYLKIGDIKGESESAMTGDANLDRQVDMDDLNDETSANSKDIAAPKPGPQKTNFSVLLSSGGSDAPAEPEKPSEDDED